MLFASDAFVSVLQPYKEKCTDFWIFVIVAFAKHNLIPFVAFVQVLKNGNSFFVEI